MRIYPSKVLKAAGGVRLPATRKPLIDPAAAGQQAAGAADLAMPGLGAALAAGAGVNTAIKAATTDEFGARTNTGSLIAQGIGGVVDPLGTIMGGINNLGNQDLNGLQKAGMFVPGLAPLITRASQNRKRKQLQAERRFATEQTAVSDNASQSYQGLTYAAEGAKVPSKTKRRPLPAGNPEQAAQYYQNVLPQVAGLLKSKHDEVYTDPVTGRQCTANSCLSFATTVQEKATGVKQPRTKANLYNPEFTRTAEEQGWERIPLDEIQAGDRLQYWNETGNAANGVDRQADLGGKQYIPNKYPSHMMVFGSWNGSDAEGRRNAVIYNDGHEFDKANRDVRGGVTEDSYVAYRFIGVNGKPTNDPKKAVAPNPQQVASRKEGGSVPYKPSVIASGALHSEKHKLSEGEVGTHGIPIITRDGKQRIAELERDELTMPRELSQQVEKLAADKDYLKLGTLVSEQIRHNTKPSKRYAKRLINSKVKTEEFKQGGELHMLDEQGRVQMAMEGEERIYSRAHTREMIESSLKARKPGDLKRLGRRVAGMLRMQDKRQAKETA